MKRTIYPLIISILLLPFSLSCSSAIYQAAYPTLSDGKYDSEFPYKNCSAELEELGRSVKLIISMAFYKTHIFGEKSFLKLEKLNSDVLSKKTIETSYFDKNESGTATIIFSSGGKIALITCAHVVEFPDTLFTYFAGETGVMTDYLQSVSFKVSQSTYIAEYSDIGELEILLLDRVLDIAVLGKNVGAQNNFRFPPLRYPHGKAKELEWGSFVYMFGYPMNFKMVSKGIVSSPNRDKKASFLLDAVVNRGFSGGTVLAIRDGVPNFEWVGIVKSVPADLLYILRPKELKTGYEYSTKIPYTGDIYIDKRLSMNYGIAFVISIESILEYLKANKETLRKKGYEL